MARKQLIVQCDHDGRDKGKVFKLLEMPSSQAEKWAMRVFIGLSRSGVEVPDNVRNSGMAAIVQLGFKMMANIRWEELEPLVDEMMDCVAYLPDPSKPTIVRNLIEDDIEEVMTRFWLKKELLKLHAGFLFADDPSTSTTGSSVDQHAK